MSFKQGRSAAGDLFCKLGVMVMNLSRQPYTRNSSSLLFVITKPSGLNMAGSRFSQACEVCALHPLFTVFCNRTKEKE